MAPRPGRRGRGPGVGRHAGRVAHDVLVLLVLRVGRLLDEADSGGEDAAAALAGLHGARGVGAAVAHALDVEQDGHLVSPRQEEVAVARVDEEVGRDRLLPSREAHGDDGAAKNAACSRGLPRRAGVGEDVPAEDGHLRHVQDVFDRSLVGVLRWWTNQRREGDCPVIVAMVAHVGFGG